MFNGDKREIKKWVMKNVMKEVKLQKIIFLLVIFALISLSQYMSLAFGTEKSSGNYVVLLHGLGRTSKSMWIMERKLADHGFSVINLDYPSRKYSIERLSGYLGNMIHSLCTDKKKKIHFVTHSFGGIILRCYLKENQVKNIGRVVMLSPPNQGSELVDNFEENIFFEIATGPSGKQLGTKSSSIPNTIGPVNFDLGIIAGNRSANPIYSRLIPGADDGKVSVNRSKVEGMADFLVVSHSHTFIMNSPEVIKQVIHFLEEGRFDKHKGVDFKIKGSIK